LKVLLVNLLAALNSANVLFLNKKRLGNKKTLKTLKNVTKIKKRKNVFYIHAVHQRPDTALSYTRAIAFHRPFPPHNGRTAVYPVIYSGVVHCTFRDANPRSASMQSLPAQTINLTAVPFAVI